MQCQYCGNQILIGSRITGDSDFCSQGHRRRFHQGLAMAIRRIQDEASLDPTGQAGFQVQTAVLDRAPQSMSWAPMVPARLRPASLLSFCLAAAGSDALREPIVQHEELVEAEMRPGQEETVIRMHQPDSASRLNRVSSILSDLRGDLEKRRRDPLDFFGQAGRTPVIQLRPAV